MRQKSLTDTTAAEETQVTPESMGVAFMFFNEIGIVNQLASALFQKRLPDGVTVAQFSVLNHLIRVRDGQTPLQLASAFQVPKTSMTHSLMKLEDKGFITLKANPNDGRSKCVWLTDSGRAFREAAIESLNQDILRLAPQLDFNAMAAALPVLQQVRQLLDKDRDEH